MSEFPQPADGGEILPPHLRPSLEDLSAQASAPGGLVCPKCGCRHFLVKGTWRVKDGTVRRLRICRYCAHPINTTERVKGDGEAPAT